MLGLKIITKKEYKYLKYVEKTLHEIFDNEKKHRIVFDEMQKRMDELGNQLLEGKITKEEYDKRWSKEIIDGFDDPYNPTALKKPMNNHLIMRLGSK